MSNLIDRLKIAYLIHKYKSPPDLYDKRGFPYWLYKNECLEDGYSDWVYGGGRIRNRHHVILVRLRWDEDSQELDLADIKVDKPLRGLGLGSQMIELIKKFAITIDKQIITGRISDVDSPIETGLFDWYRHHGFEIIYSDKPKQSVFVADIRLVL